MEKLYFGLDISTTAIGYSSIHIIDYKVDSILYSHYCPNKKLPKIEMLFTAKNKIISEIKAAEQTYGIKASICIEDILLFMKKSTNTTVTALSAINRVLCVYTYEHSCANLRLIPVQTIRAQLKKMAGLKDRVDKEKVPEVIEQIIRANHIPNWTFQWELMTRGKNKGKPTAINYDRADGLAVGLVGAFLNKDLK